MRRFRTSPFFKFPAGLGIGIFCALIVLLGSALGLLDGAESAALDRLFRARGSRAADPRVTLIVTDDATVATIDQWPLPRRKYAQAIEILTRGGARTIACDLLFSVPSYSRQDDALLERVCAKSGRVVQAMAFQSPQMYEPIVPSTEQSERNPLQLRFAVRDARGRTRDTAWVSAPLAPLQASAPAVGHINIHPELDGTLRRVQHLIRFQDHLYPSLSLAATAHFLGLGPKEIVAEAGDVHLEPRDGVPIRMPLDRNGEAWVNWAGGNQTFPTYNLNQLFEGRVPPEAIKDHLVMLGVTAAGAFESRATPFSAVQPAIELQANAVRDLLARRPLIEAAPAWQFALALGFAVAVGFVCAPRRAQSATLWLGALTFALWLGGVGALRHDLYLHLAAPTLAGLLTYVVAMALNYRREWESNWRTDASVAALARGGALMASGHQRDLLMSVIRRTAREVLQARDVFLVLQDEGESGSSDNARQGISRSAYAHRLPTLGEAARRIASAGGVVLWSVGMRVHPTHERSGDSLNGSPATSSDAALSDTLEQLTREVKAAHERMHVTSRHAFDSIVAAPLPAGAEASTFPDEGEERVGASKSAPMRGVLVATGRRDGAAFTGRDAVLLQTLAEQASLALDNLEYYERLHGRIELANRDLREAYRVLSQERLTLSEERTKLAAAVESMESALVIADENDGTVFDNGMGAHWLWRVEPAPGESVPAALRAHNLPELAQLFESVRTGEGTESPHKATVEVTRVQEREPGQPPERSILAAQLTPLVAANGRRLGSMLVVTDVTAERELEQMKSDFVAFVAHELRSPLTSIGGFATLLKMHAATFEAQTRDELLTSIETQCERLNRMISDLLEVARLEPGHQIQLRPTTFDLVTLCEKVLAQQQIVAANAHRLTLQMHAGTRPIEVTLDPDRIEQVLINLLSNAIKYSPDGGQVNLEVQTEDGTVVLRVRDTGMGMTPEQVTHLFQKYYRTPDAQARGIKGTGLGLYLVKQLIEAQDGSIEAASQAGQGTTFTVTLPM